MEWNLIRESVKKLLIDEGVPAAPASIAGRYAEKGYDAIVTARRQLEDLEKVYVTAKETGDFVPVYNALRSFANYAGYSNTPMTAMSELATAAGGFAAILESTL